MPCKPDTGQHTNNSRYTGLSNVDGIHQSRFLTPTITALLKYYSFPLHTSILLDTEGGTSSCEVDSDERLEFLLLPRRRLLSDTVVSMIPRSYA